MADLNKLAEQVATATAALTNAEREGVPELERSIIALCVAEAQREYADGMAEAGKVLHHAGRFYATTVGSA
jgi:hypothetical protein